MTPDEILMQKIKTLCGEEIAEAVAGTGIPAAFLAALAANESGGDPAAARFEPQIFMKLGFLAVGRIAAFGSIGRQDLLEFVSPPGMAFSDSMLTVINLATSWGLTQIMGYQALAGHYRLSELPSLQTHFPRAVQMLQGFAKEFPAIPAWGTGKDAAVGEAFFRCWNTGKPAGVTYDPQYISNGLNRMAIYASME